MHAFHTNVSWLSAYGARLADTKLPFTKVDGFGVESSSATQILQAGPDKIDIMMWGSPHAVPSDGESFAAPSGYTSSSAFKSRAFASMAKQCTKGLVLMPYPARYPVSFVSPDVDDDRMLMVFKARYYKHCSAGSGTTQCITTAKDEKIAMLVPPNALNYVFQFCGVDGRLMVGPFLLTYYRKVSRQEGPRAIELGCNTASLSCELTWASLNGY